jgi:pimeloyl-ACP methyl ester carboxylesterase
MSQSVIEGQMTEFMPMDQYDAGSELVKVPLEDIEVPIFFYVAQNDASCSADHAKKLAKRVKAKKVKINETHDHYTYWTFADIYTDDFVYFVNSLATNGIVMSALATFATLSAVL